MTTDKRLSATSEGVRDAWDFWLSQHNVSVPDTIERAVRAEVRSWLAAHTDELIAAIAEAAAKPMPDTTKAAEPGGATGSTVQDSEPMPEV